MILFCKIGLHRWRDLWVRNVSDTETDVLARCTRCGKERRERLWGPFSGNHKPHWPKPSEVNDEYRARMAQIANRKFP